MDVVTINFNFQFVIKDDGLVSITVPGCDRQIGLQAYSKICNAFAEAENKINTNQLILKLSKTNGTKRDECND